MKIYYIFQYNIYVYIYILYLSSKKKEYKHMCWKIWKCFF